MFSSRRPQAGESKKRLQLLSDSQNEQIKKGEMFMRSNIHHNLVPKMMFPRQRLHAYQVKTTMYFIIKAAPQIRSLVHPLGDGTDPTIIFTAPRLKGNCEDRDLPWKQPLCCACYWADHLSYYQLLFFICGSWARAKYSSWAPRVCVCVCLRNRSGNCVGSSQRIGVCKGEKKVG